MIEVRSLSYAYPHAPANALENISAQVGSGEVVGIVGPNGSGKSTLGRLMKGLLLPGGGDVLVDGQDTRLHGLEVRRRVGLVFQNPNSQIVNAVVEHEVAFGLENLGMQTDEMRTRVGQALEAVGLQGQETAECHSLSMANKQRVAIASVMAMEPDYLILDEPTAWLEPSARWPLLEEVMQWCQRRDVGLVLVTHRMDEAQVCVRLYGMLDGQLEAVGSPDAVLGDTVIRSRLALEVPETLELAGDLAAAGLPVSRGSSIERLADALCRS